MRGNFRNVNKEFSFQLSTIFVTLFAVFYASSCLLFYFIYCVILFVQFFIIYWIL